MEEHTVPEYQQPDLELEPGALDAINSAGKWAKFLAILMFVGLGALVIIGFIMISSIMVSKTGMPWQNMITLFGYVYLFVAMLFFFPVKFLFQFADKSKQALQNKDNGILTEAMKKLNAHYKFISILMIVGMGIYALVFLFVSLPQILGW